MKWILRGLGLVVVMVLVAGVSLLFLPMERLARIATDQLSAQTGRDVTISGDVALTVWPVLGLNAERLEIGGPRWSTEGPMVQADRVAIGVDARRLIGGDVHITGVELVRPTIRLEQKADGRASWELDEATAPERTGSKDGDDGAEPAAPTASRTTPAQDASRALHIERVRVTDATFIFDAEGEDLIRYDRIDLDLDWPNPDAPVVLAAQVQPAGTPIAVNAEVADIRALADGAQQPVSFRMQAGADSLSFDGSASMEGPLTGQLRLQTGDTDDFLRALGLNAVDLPPALGRSVDLASAVSLTPEGSVSLRELVIDLDGNVLRGAVDLDLADTPEVRAQLDAGDLDLRPVVAEPASKSSDKTSQTSKDTPQAAKPKRASKPATGSGGWPNDPIDASGLSSFNGTISLTANSVDLGTLKLGPTRTVLRNKRSRMVFELREIAAYGGSVKGEFVVNNRNGLSVGGRINAANLQMQPVLRDTIDVDRLTGAADLQMSFLGVGETVDAIMNSLSGDGRLSVGTGTILGLDLDRLMRGGDVGGGTTIFDSLSGTWSIKDGVMFNDDLLLQLKNYEARGDGQVGLVAQTLDYTFTPVALRANSGQGLAIPIRLHGQWSDVSVRPDIEAALDQRVDVEVKKLEEDAKQKVDQKLDEADKKLDDLIDEAGSSLEDEIKDRLLRKLFD